LSKKRNQHLGNQSRSTLVVRAPAAKKANFQRAQFCPFCKRITQSAGLGDGHRDSESPLAAKIIFFNKKASGNEAATGTVGSNNDELEMD
jgi:hypothetical protein